MSINENFIEQLIIKANPNIEDDAIDLFLEDIRPILEEWVMNHIMWKLTDDQLYDYTQLIKSHADDKKIHAYLNKTIIDYDNFIQKVYQEFEDMYLKEYKNFSE